MSISHGIFKCQIIFLNIILMAMSAFTMPTVHSVYHVDNF